VFDKFVIAVSVKSLVLDEFEFSNFILIEINIAKDAAATKIHKLENLLSKFILF